RVRGAVDPARGIRRPVSEVGFGQVAVTRAVDVDVVHRRAGRIRDVDLRVEGVLGVDQRRRLGHAQAGRRAANRRDLERIRARSYFGGYTAAAAGVESGEQGRLAAEAGGPRGARGRGHGVRERVGERAPLLPIYRADRRLGAMITNDGTLRSSGDDLELLL